MAASGYTVNNLMAGTPQNCTTTPGITVLRLAAPTSAVKRFYVWEIDLGQQGNPVGTDCYVTWWLAQCDATGNANPTLNGTSTSITPLSTNAPLAGDVAVTVARANFTVEPTTYTAANSFYTKTINQRGAAFWQAAPGGEIYLPSTTGTGPGLRFYSATYNLPGVARMNFTEI